MPITDNWSNSIFRTVMLAAFVVGVETGDCHGSGGGRDALELEKRGISVRRTDISKGFVELL
ncbi:hypothetical protein C7476_13622, partial [Phyllobacterium bourgognense]